MSFDVPATPVEIVKVGHSALRNGTRNVPQELFWLASSEMAFRKQNLMNFQIQVTKRQGVAPMTRDYIGHEEKRVLAVEQGKRPRQQIAGEPLD
jgi:hypothetical protein